MKILWYLASLLIIFLAFKLTIKYKFLQFNFKKIFSSLKSKSNNGVTPFSSLCLSLGAKIGVGSLSGVAITLYYGGVGAIFFMMIISLIIAINTYFESYLGIKSRVKLNGKLSGGPSYYISKYLGKKHWGLIYAILLITSYSIVSVAIQANTIVKIGMFFHIKGDYVIITLVILIVLIIGKGLKRITSVSNMLVPVMIGIYFLLGVYVFLNNYQLLFCILKNEIYKMFNMKTIIPIFLIGMQRAIFITESTTGTSAISASICENDPEKQGLMEVFGIYITIFLVCLTTFIIIVSSNYLDVSFSNINGIEILLYAFNYHFGYLGSILLSVITLMFAFSTIISGYFFGESNLDIFGSKKIFSFFGWIFILVIVISYYLGAHILWRMIDYLTALLVIINGISLLKIIKKGIG